MNSYFNQIKNFIKTSDDFELIDFHFGLFLQKFSEDFKQEAFLTGASLSRFSREGHTCIDRIFLDNFIKKSGFDFQFNWDNFFDKAEIIGSENQYKPVIFHNEKIYLQKYFNYEKIIKEKILEKTQIHIKFDKDKKDIINIISSLFQREDGINWPKIAAAVSISKKFTAITGGPGTGKTHTVSRIIALWLKININKKIVIAAPTGKAASRLNESIRQAKEEMNISNEIKEKFPEKAFTLHRLLRSKRYSSSFRHNKENPLAYDIVIVDEASMIALPLMAKLLQALDAKTQLILLGDRNQLASVEVGSVFGDICRDENVDSFTDPFLNFIKHELNQNIDLSYNSRKTSLNGWIENSIVELKKSHRFTDKSSIKKLSYSVNNGDFENVIKILNDKSAENVNIDNYFFKSLWKNLKDIIQTYFNFKKENYNIRDIFNYMNKFKILCALRKGIAGVQNINKLIEDILGKNGVYEFKPIIIKENDYNIKLFNGDSGIFLRDEDGNLKAFFEDEDSENGFRSINPARLPSYEPAYAITIHKSQGSEWENILILLPQKFNPVLSRELLYTAITRTKKNILIASENEIIKKMTKTQVNRISGL
ncbi:MAG: exodeoxyribonuclease V subunit alpha [Candidatus Muiribacteriota bacterium]